MSSGLKRGLWLCCALLACPAGLRAQQADTTQGVGSSPVLVVEVGHAGDWHELERVLRDFLAQHRLIPTFQSRATLTRLDALGESPNLVPCVFVELVSAERARLVLSDESRARYLLRDVPLPNGLDEVGRETLAQVIESSLLALRGQARTLSRSELNQLLSNETATAVPATAPNDGAAPENVRDSVPKATVVAPLHGTRQASKSAASNVPSTASSRSRFQLAGAYVVQWSGQELGLLHGPALRLEWEPSSYGRKGWFVAATGELHGDQSYESSLVGVNVASRAAWLTAGIKPTWFGDVRFVAAAGLGVGWAEIEPRDVEGGLPHVLANSSDTTAWGRAELGLECRLAPFYLALWLLSDVSMMDTHYDVTRAGRAERLITPWRVRPGLRVALGWGN